MMTLVRLMSVPCSAGVADRITEVRYTPSSVALPEAGAVTDTIDHLEFDHVEFTYPGAEQPVLREISFDARPGETVAIIGSTGAGKSTLVNLVPRLFDATAGAVRIDGVDKIGRAHV